MIKLGRMLLIGLCMLGVSPAGIANNAADEDQRIAVLREAIRVVSENAYNSSKVEWASVGASALEILARDNTEAGLNASIGFLISKLKDGHSSYHSNAPAAGKSSAPPLLRAPMPIAELSIKSGGFPVVRVNAWSGNEPAEVRAAAKSVRDTLNKALSQEACGVILDFSSNPGGNMWPMLAGLLPLLSEGTLGAFERADGVRTTIVSTGDGLALGGRPHFVNWPKLDAPRFQPKFLALIIGPKTASSGEITTLMFRGQSNARVFGSRTAGYASGNRGFKLSDGSTLVLTTSATIDRDGKKYWGPLDPDVKSDHPLVSANDWLRGQCQ